MNKPDFWGKKDDVSMTRSLRLAVIQNLFSQDLLDKEQARELLASPLEPDDPSTIYDDSEWLNTSEEWAQSTPTERTAVILSWE